MGITKKINFDSLFIFIFLALFSFGQIIRLKFNLFGLTIPLQPIDMVVGVGALYSLIFQKQKTKAFGYLSYFLGAAAFSFLFSVFFFKTEVIYGSFYLIRLASYLVFLNYVWNFTRKSIKNRELMIGSLLSVSVVSAIFGWVQFFAVPDLKPLYYIGWDMHLFRLVGSFLDPTFLGLIIVFGLIVSISQLINNHEKKYLFITIFLLVSLAFTYSRASYLAFLGGVFVIALVEKKFRKLFFFVTALLLIAVLLPTAKNHSIELTRTFSISAKINNYKEAITVFNKFPLFGVGYDNLCVARNKFIGAETFASHACSGSDSSLLLILVTMGLMGLMVFMGSVASIAKVLKNGYRVQILGAASVALLIHSLFSNSLFFPWIMGYMIILLAVSLKE